MSDAEGPLSREAERQIKRAEGLTGGSSEHATALIHEARTTDTVEKNLSTWKAFIAWAVIRGHAADEAAYQAMEFDARVEVRLPACMRKRIRPPRRSLRHPSLPAPTHPQIACIYTSALFHTFGGKLSAVKAISGAANMVHEVGYQWAHLPSPWSTPRVRTMYKGMRRVSKSLGVRSTHGYVLTEREYRDMIIHLYKKAMEVLETHTNKAYKYLAAAAYASACCCSRARGGVRECVLL